MKTSRKEYQEMKLHKLLREYKKLLTNYIKMEKQIYQFKLVGLIEEAKKHVEMLIF